MSAIASFFLLNVSQLDDLKNHAEIIVKKGLFSKKVTDSYKEYLVNNATTLNSLNGSGYIYANLFIYLQEEKNIDLLTNEYDELARTLVDKRGSSHFIFTHSQKILFLPQLQPSLFSRDEIKRFNHEFSEESDEETATLTIEAIGVLHVNLEKLENDKQVLLLIVG